MQEHFEKWLDRYWPLWRQSHDTTKLNDLQSAFTAGYEYRPLKWVTRDGEKLEPSEMDTRHIINCVNLLKRKGYVSSRTQKFYISGPQPEGEMASYYYDQEYSYVMDAPVSLLLDRFEEILEERGHE